MENDTQNSSGHLKRDDLRLVNTVRNGEKFSGSNRTKALISKDNIQTLCFFNTVFRQKISRKEQINFRMMNR